MRYTTRPLSDRTWLRPHSQRKTSRFDSTWSSTLKLLGREIDLLGGRDVVMEIDVREQDLRLDGGLRANARPETPAVVVAFETSQHGPMLYRCDRFTWSSPSAALGWQANVRAIALTLEALRAVDRYGATETGQQYTGFKALPAGRAMPASHMTTEEACNLIAYVSWPNERAENRAEWSPKLAADADLLAAELRRARAAAHPDRNNGDRTLWDQVEQAAKVLGVAS